MAVCNTEQPGSENLVLKIPCELQFAPKVYIIDPIAIRGVECSNNQSHNKSRA